MNPEDIMRENLMFLAQTLARAKNWSLSSASKQIHGNGAFFRAYAAGEVSTTIKNYFVMVNRIREFWPPDEQWPETKPIPKLGKIFDKGYEPTSSRALVGASR